MAEPRDDTETGPAAAGNSGRTQPSRRAVLLGGAAALAVGAAGGIGLVEARVLPGRNRLHRVLGMDGGDGAIPDVEPGHRVGGTFASAARGRDTTWSLSYPPGSGEGDRLPVLIGLHGKGGDHRQVFDDLGLDRFLAAAVGEGASPFAVASVDGGVSYWHRRADGTDSGAMVADELVPLLADRGLDTSRLGLAGWSMGGYGALLLTTGAVRGDGPRLTPRVVVTGGAALWTDAGDSAPGAFDDGEDFADHDVFARRAELAGVPLRIDCGTDDPFVGANRAFVRDLPAVPAGGFQPGAHTFGYWRRMLPDQVAFVARHLAG